MDIMELGAIGELVGGVAVIATLVYLAVQVKQNTSVMQTNAAYQLYEYLNSSSLLMIENSEVSQLVELGRSDPDSLSEDDWPRFFEFAIIRFSVWEAAFLSLQRGMIDDSLWESWDRGMCMLLGGPGFRRCWEEAAATYTEAFQEHVTSVAPKPSLNASVEGS